MERNQIIGMVLMGLLVVAFIFSSQKANDEEAKLNNTEQSSETNKEDASTPSLEKEESTANIIPEENVVELDSTQKAELEKQKLSTYGIFALANRGTQEAFELKNDLLETTISNKGGMFETAVITQYNQYNSDINIRLWNELNSGMNFTFDYNGKGRMNTEDFYFKKIGSSSEASDGSPAYLNLRLETSDPNKYIDFKYTLPYDTYEIGFEMDFVGLSSEINTTSENIALNWELEGISNEKSITYERQSSSVFYREVDEGRDYLRESTIAEEVLENKLNWFSFKQKFFSALVINDSGFETGAKLTSRPPENEKDSLINMIYTASAPLAATGNSNTKLRFFLGPNDYKELQKLETEEVSRIIDYGPWIIGWVNRNVVRPIFFFFSKYISNAGVVILLLTVLIKMLLFPITWKNYLSSAKMRVLKPDIEALGEKFKGKEKATEKQQATMALYRKTGVNPFAGCIPVILQMPILYAMFRFFPASIEVRGKSFLWADDLSAYDTLVKIPEIPFYGAHISGFTVLMAISTFIYTRMNSANMAQPSQPGMPNMKVIMNIFPLFMLFIFNSFASGLSLYYFVANMISIGQMWTIKKYFIDEDKIRAKIDTNKQKVRKKSSFQQRLEDMQKEQQTKLKKQRKK